MRGQKFAEIFWEVTAGTKKHPHVIKPSDLSLYLRKTHVMTLWTNSTVGMWKCVASTSLLFLTHLPLCFISIPKEKILKGFNFIFQLHFFMCKIISLKMAWTCFKIVLITRILYPQLLILHLLYSCFWETQWKEWLQQFLEMKNHYWKDYQIHHKYIINGRLK